MEVHHKTDTAYQLGALAQIVQTARFLSSTAAKSSEDLTILVLGIQVQMT